MSLIPDSISSEKLEELHCDAIIEEILNEDTTPLSKREWTPEDYLRINNELDEKIEEYCDPVVDKMIIMQRLSRLMGWHSEMSIDVPADEQVGKLCWGRDAGKLQAMMCIIDGICMGENDFTYKEED